MRLRLFPLLLATVFAAILAQAQEESPRPAAKPASESTPAKVSKFFRNMFRGKEKPVATPIPATPSQRTRPRPGSGKRPPAAPAPAPTEPGSDTPPSAPTATPAKNTTKKPPAGPTKEQTALTKAIAGGDPDTIEKARYDEVKSRAVVDPKIAELRAAAENAASDDESRRALRTYNKALFQKMRELEPTIESRIERMESATMRQIGGPAE